MLWWDETGGREISDGTGSKGIERRKVHDCPVREYSGVYRQRGGNLKRQIEQYNEISVTDLEMIRYYTSVEGVAELFFALIDRGENGKIYFTPTGEPQILKDVVNTVIKLYGNKDTKVKCIGLRDGERMYEKMCTPNEKNVVGEFVGVKDNAFPQPNMKTDKDKIFLTEKR